MTDAPYSDAWREHTRVRMAAANLTRAEVVKRTGLPNIVVHDALETRSSVSLEVAGPIDELLDAVEAIIDSRLGHDA